MQFRIFVPYNADLRYIVSALEPLTIRDNPSVVLYAPQSQRGVEDRIVIDRWEKYPCTETYPNPKTRIHTIRSLDTNDRVVSVLDLGEREKVEKLKINLNGNFSGEILLARYPVRAEHGEVAKMAVLKGDVDPGEIRRRLTAVLEEKCGDEFAFSEEVLIGEF